MIKVKPIVHENIQPIQLVSHYSSRTTYSEFIAGHFVPILSGRILDVGCFEKDLYVFLPETINYFGIELYGN